MAKREVVTITDDLDPSRAADVTIDFGIDGATFQIDLSQANADRLGAALAPYIGAARRVGPSATRSRRSSATAGADTAAVKAWAEANGIAYNARGRLPATLVQQFRDSAG